MSSAHLDHSDIPQTAGFSWQWASENTWGFRESQPQSYCIYLGNLNPFHPIVHDHHSKCWLFIFLLHIYCFLSHTLLIHLFLSLLTIFTILSGYWGNFPSSSSLPQMAPGNTSSRALPSGGCSCSPPSPTRMGHAGKCSVPFPLQCFPLLCSTVRIPSVLTPRSSDYPSYALAPHGHFHAFAVNAATQLIASLFLPCFALLNSIYEDQGLLNPMHTFSLH